MTSTVEPSAGNTADIRICFIGDSFVNGTGDETALGWAGRLCADAAGGGRPVTYYNLGVRRDTSADVLRRWEAECRPRLPGSCDGRIVVSCGVNDTTVEDGAPRVAFEESCENMRRILRGARAYTPLLVGPPPVDDDEQNARIEHLSRAFSEIAASMSIPYIELFPNLVDDASYRAEIAGYDGAHPRSTGYGRIAALVGSSPDWWFPAVAAPGPPARHGE